MTGSERPLRPRPAPGPKDPSCPGRKHKRSLPLRYSGDEDPLFDIQQVASATECTGILPAQVETGPEGEAVSSLESIHPIQPRFPEEDGEP